MYLHSQVCVCKNGYTTYTLYTHAGMAQRQLEKLSTLSQKCKDIKLYCCIKYKNKKKVYKRTLTL